MTVSGMEMLYTWSVRCVFYMTYELHCWWYLVKMSWDRDLTKSGDSCEYTTIILLRHVCEWFCSAEISHWRKSRNSCSDIETWDAVCGSVVIWCRIFHLSLDIKFWGCVKPGEECSFCSILALSRSNNVIPTLWRWYAYISGWSCQQSYACLKD